MVKFTKQELEALKSINNKIVQNCIIKDCDNCPFDYQFLCPKVTIDDLILDMESNMEK